jgi:hypothetical protein
MLKVEMKRIETGVENGNYEEKGDCPVIRNSLLVILKSRG